MSKPIIDLSELYHPHPQQVKAHLASEKTVLFGGAIRGGKTMWMVAEGIQLSIDYPGNVGILCRQDMPSFKRTVLVELEKYQDVGIDINGHWQKLVIQHHQTDHTFTIYTGKDKPPSTIWYTGLGDDTRGLASKMGMTLGWFGIDQVEETAEVHFNNMMGRLSLNIPGIRYKALLTANPMPGWVKMRFIESHPDDFIYIPSLPKDNPYLPEGYEEGLRKIYPEELVKSWLEGNWDVMEGGNFLFRYADIRKAVNRELEVKADDIKWSGVDIAREGDDTSVFTLRQGGKVLYIDVWGKSDEMETTGIILTKLERFGVEDKNVNVDAMPAGVYDRLRELKHYVNGIIFGGTAKDTEHYINIRAEMYDNLRKLFEAGTINIPDDPDLIAQLSSIRFEIASDKKLQIVSKKEMKRTYHLKSPDKADSLALAFYEPIQRNPQIRWL